MKPVDRLTPQLTADGSVTFFSETFQEAFHSYYGAKQEAEHKFVIPCRVGAWAKTGRVRILDICFGLGYNTAAALGEIWQVNPDCLVEWRGLELNLAVPQAAVEQGYLNHWSQEIQEAIRGLVEHLTYRTPQFQAQLWLGDARQTLPQLLDQQWQADVIFLDPFSPPHCPQLWTVEFLEMVSQALAPMGYLATYSAAAAVRQALSMAGLVVGATLPMGRKSPGTLARWLNEDLQALTPVEAAHLETKAAIPYRDPTLQATAAEILQQRQAEQAQSPLISSSQWRRQWFSTKPGQLGL